MHHLHVWTLLLSNMCLAMIKIIRAICVVSANNECSTPPDQKMPIKRCVLRTLLNTDFEWPLNDYHHTVVRSICTRPFFNAMFPCTSKFSNWSQITELQGKMASKKGLIWTERVVSWMSLLYADPDNVTHSLCKIFKFWSGGVLPISNSTWSTFWHSLSTIRPITPMLLLSKAKIAMIWTSQFHS